MIYTDDFIQNMERILTSMSSEIEGLFKSGYVAESDKLFADREILIAELNAYVRLTNKTVEVK
jgi:hypothetical protein